MWQFVGDFAVYDVLLNCENIFDKVKKLPYWSLSFLALIFFEKDPKTRKHDFYVRARTYHTENFSSIPTTDPDNISQNTLNFWPIFKF